MKLLGVLALLGLIIAEVGIVLNADGIDEVLAGIGLSIFMDACLVAFVIYARDEMERYG